MKRIEQRPLPALTPARLRQIAVAADVVPPTVARVIAGQPTKASLRERVVKALRQLGLDAYVPEEVQR